MAYRGGYTGSSERLGTSSVTSSGGCLWPVRHPVPAGGDGYAYHLPRASSSQPELEQPRVLPTHAPSRIKNHDAEMSFPSRRWKEQMIRQQVGFLHMRTGQTRFTPTTGITEMQLGGGLCVIFPRPYLCLLK